MYKTNEKINENEYHGMLLNHILDHHLKQLVKHQIESYNYFVNTQIENTIEMFNLFIFVQNMIILKNMIYID